MDYGFGVASERRSSYRDEYSSRGSGYADLPRGAARTSTRRSYVDEGYGQRFDRPPPSYREGRARDYESISGSKRSYSAMVGNLYAMFICYFLHIQYSLPSGEKVVSNIFFFCIF